MSADPSRVHQGEPLAVVYDPGHPQVVSLASDVGDTSPAWVETILGAFFLALVPLVGFWFGFNEESRIIVATLASLFPITTNALHGCLSAKLSFRTYFTCHTCYF